MQKEIISDDWISDLCKRFTNLFREIKQVKDSTLKLKENNKKLLDEIEQEQFNHNQTTIESNSQVKILEEHIKTLSSSPNEENQELHKFTNSQDEIYLAIQILQKKDVDLNEELKKTSEKITFF